MPSAGEPAVTVSRRAASSAMKSSIASMSASGPWPVTTPSRRSIVCHSCSMPSRSGSEGGVKLAMLRIESW